MSFKVKLDSWGFKQYFFRQNENPSSNFYYQRGTVGKVEFRTAPQHEAQAKDSPHVDCWAFSVWSWRSNIDQ